MTDETTNLPTINYKEGDEDAQTRFEVVKEGTFFAEVTSTKRDVTKNGHMRVRLSMSLLNDEGTTTPNSVFYDLLMPHANPAVEGHKPPKTAGRCYAAMRAMDPSLSAYPRWDRTTQTYFNSEGNEITKSEYLSLQKEFNKMACKATEAWWTDPDQLVGEQFFIKVSHNVGTNGNTYTNVDEVYSSPPAGVEVITKDFTE